MVTRFDEPQTERQHALADELMQAFSRHLRESPHELNMEQREMARTMFRSFSDDILAGRHPIIGELLTEAKTVEEEHVRDKVKDDIVSAISRQVVGWDTDDHVGNVMEHHLNESDEHQQSPLETPAEALQRKRQYMKQGLENYLELEQTERDELSGKEQSGRTLELLSQRKHMRVPGTHERSLMNQTSSSMWQGMHPFSPN